MASRLLTDLHPKFEPLVNGFLNDCVAAGITILVTCTYRSGEEQNELYAQGRTKPGRIITNARSGQSKHNYTVDGKPAALAVDIVPMVAGKPVWGTQGEDLALWQQVGKIGEARGMGWAGNWKSFKEFPHFEWKGANP